MRGFESGGVQLFYSVDFDGMIRRDHPLRKIKAVVDEVLVDMNGVFNQAYSVYGRPSVPPEKLLKALLLQVLYTIRSERQLVERIHTDILFRWFCDYSIEDTVFNHSTFSINRDRITDNQIMTEFFDRVLKHCSKFCSNDHFSIDGTIIESAASIKSFLIKPEQNNTNNSENNTSGENDTSSDRNDGSDGNNGSDRNGGSDGGDATGDTGGGVDLNSFKSRNVFSDFRGSKPSNKTHRSVTDPDARLYRKGVNKPGFLCHFGHVMVENRNGIITAADMSIADGMAERKTAISLIDRYKKTTNVKVFTLGADKGYDSGSFLLELEERKIIPHVAMKNIEPGGTPVNKRKQEEREARQRLRQRQQEIGYKISQQKRKKVEEPFGWIKNIGGLSKSRWFNAETLKHQFILTTATYNLIRLTNLTTQNN